MRSIVLAALVAASPLLAPGAAARAESPSPAAAAASGTTVYQVPASLDQLARCNDGTLPEFWVRQGAPGVNTWVIWFEGGSDCFDSTSCAARATGKTTQRLTTSNGFTAADGASGILSDNTANPLHNANTVLLHYCSSDTWAGNLPPTTTTFPYMFNPNDTRTWFFEGRRIAQAQINTLVNLNLGLNSQSTIILGGTSAGGIGVTVDTNDILRLLPAGARTLFVNDAGYALRIGDFDAGAPPTYVNPSKHLYFDMALQQRLAFWNGRGDLNCFNAATTPEQQVACYDTSYVLRNGYITLPSFVAESQLDTAQIHQQLCPPYGLGANGKPCAVSADPSSPQGAYATAFAKAMADSLSENGPNVAFTVFSPDQYDHELLECDNSFPYEYPFPTPGNPAATLSPSNALTAWLMNTGMRVVNVASQPGVESTSLSPACGGHKGG